MVNNSDELDMDKDDLLDEEEGEEMEGFSVKNDEDEEEDEEENKEDTDDDDEEDDDDDSAKNDW